MTDVVMPQMGESIVEGTLTKWLKKPGDRVERDEPLFEISTDKVDTEVPSPVAGTLAEALVEEGKTVAIKTVVARIDEGGGAVAVAPVPSRDREGAEPAPQVPQSAVSSPAAPRQDGGPLGTPAPPPIAPAEPAGPLSPLVRKMAREHNLDLSRVAGTGAGGRITKQDVEAYLGQSGPSAVPAGCAGKAGGSAARPTAPRPEPRGCASSP